MVSTLLWMAGSGVTIVVCCYVLAAIWSGPKHGGW
jgi:hypothetical protein